MNNFVCMMMESKNSNGEVVEVPFYLNVNYITDITEDRDRDPQQDNATVYVQLEGDDEPLTFRNYRGGAHGFMADIRRQHFNGPSNPFGIGSSYEVKEGKWVKYPGPKPNGGDY